MTITLTLADALAILGIIALAGAIVAGVVFALVRNVQPDTEAERAESVRDNQRRSHPEVWP